MSSRLLKTSICCVAAALPVLTSFVGGVLQYAPTAPVLAAPCDPLLKISTLEVPEGGIWNVLSSRLDPSRAGLAWAAEEPTPSVPATVAEAVTVAFVNRPELHVADAEVRAAAARLAEARGAFWPRVVASGSVDRIEALDEFAGVEVTVGGVPVSVERDVPRYLVDARVETTWNLFAGGLDRARVAEAQAGLQRAEARRAMARNTVALEVVTAYWELKKAGIESALGSRAAEIAREQARVSAARFAEGRVAEIEHETDMLAAIEKRLAAAAAVQRLHERGVAYLDALALAREGDLGNEEVAIVLTDEPDDFDLAAFDALSGGERPELVQARSETAAASAAVDSARAAWYPTVDLSGRYGAVGRDRTAVGGAWSDLRGQDWAVGLRMQWTLFDGFETRARIARSRADAEAAAWREAQTRRSLAASLQTQRGRVQTLERDLELARRRLVVGQAKAQVAQTRLDLAQLTAAQYAGTAFEVEDLTARVQLTAVDLVLAKIALKAAE